MRKYLALSLAVFALLLFGHAFADAGGASTTSWWPLVWLSPYVPILIPTLAGLQAVVVREQSSASGFWHTSAGHVVLVLFGALMGAGLHWLQGGVLDKKSLLAALAGGATAFWGAWKTGSKVDPANGASTAAPTPPVTRAAALLPILFLFGLSGCAHVDMKKYDAAFGSCMAAKGLTDGAGVGAQILSSLDAGLGDTNAITSKLEGILVAAGGTAVEDVAVCAVIAWQAQNPVPAAGPQAKPTPSQVAARIFVAKHTVVSK